MNKELIPLVLFSGMGADEAVFAGQKTEFPRLIVPRWIKPLRNECLTEYCDRMAEQIDLPGPCIVGGASFGGIIAQTIAGKIDAKACVLIGSVGSPDQLPWRIRCWRPFCILIPIVPIRLFQFFVGATRILCRWFLSRHLTEILRQFSAADADVLRWSISQLYQWKPGENSVPILHIHGNRDPIFPLKNVSPDQTVDDGGHVISMTHPDQVNRFLESAISRYHPQDGTDSRV